MRPRTPLASLSLDLDNLWTYLKVRNDLSWRERPSFLHIVVPRFMDFASRHGVRATVFVVGEDAADPRHKAILRSIAADGHEIANHSFRHEPWLGSYGPEETETEISRAHAAIADIATVAPRGFRGPGFALSTAVLETLAAKGYLYDASTLPTFIGPLARAFYFRNARLSNEAKAQRSDLFGGFSEGFRPIKPYLWRLGERRLLEIPVTTMPGLRLPLHASYVIYLSAHGHTPARAYLGAAMWLLQQRRVEPSFLLHPLDFLGAGEAPGLSFFPGMNLTFEHKLGILDDVITALARRHAIVPIKDHAEAILARGGLRLLGSPRSSLDHPANPVSAQGGVH